MITANTQTAEIASKLAQSLFIYPITPSTGATQHAFDINPLKTFQTSSELGSIAGVHGAGHYNVPAGTFTSSQGLLLMIPSILKMTGERVPGVIHVAARSLATHSLSIQGDHQDIALVARSGAVIISSKNAQSCYQDAITAYFLSAKLQQPVIHFYDGFITSDELVKNSISLEHIEQFYEEFLAKNGIQRALGSKNVGMIAGSNCHFQMTEAQTFEARNYVNEINEVSAFLSEKFGFEMKPFEGMEKQNCDEIKHLFISCGSSVDSLKFVTGQDENSDFMEIKLFRPFQHQILAKMLTKYKNLETVTVLDRYREITSPDTELLYLDLLKTQQITQQKYKILAGVYGLSGKEFSFKEADLVLQNAKSQTLKNFTVGIHDDLNHTSLNDFFQPKMYKNPGTTVNVYSVGSEGVITALNSFGNSIQKNVNFIGQKAHYDAKKSGGNVRTELRFGNEYVPEGFSGIVGIGNLNLLKKNAEIYDKISENGVVVINGKLSEIKEKFRPEVGCSVYNIDLEQFNLKKNNFHYVYFLARVLEKEGQINASQLGQIKADLIDKLQKRQPKDLDLQLNLFTEIENFKLESCRIEAKKQEMEIPLHQFTAPPYQISNDTPTSYFAKIREGFSHATNRKNKHNLAKNIPIWLDKDCIACGKCVSACPHACIEAFLLNEQEFKVFSKLSKKNIKHHRIGLFYYVIQSSPVDCTGCNICAEICPTAALKMVKNESQEIELSLFEYASGIATQSDYSKRVPKTKTFTDKSLQFINSQLKYHSACAGCGETSYINLLTKVSPNLKIIQGTGCPLAYLGDIGDQPFSGDIFWTNSLFEDTAEVALGMKFQQSLNGQKGEIWAIQGDGSAYDIDFQGVDAFARSKLNLNMLVLDTHGYSNTGGQKSGSSAFSSNMKLGSNSINKNLILMLMHYKNAYMATISSNDISRSAKILKKAQDFDGPSIVIAYSTCISHKAKNFNSITQAQLAVETGLFPLLEFDPREERGKRLVLQSEKAKSISEMHEGRFSESNYSAIDHELNERLEDIKGLCSVM